MSKSVAIVGSPTVTKPASSVEIIVTQTTVTKTIAVVPLVGACIEVTELAVWTRSASETPSLLLCKLGFRAGTMGVNAA